MRALRRLLAVMLVAPSPMGCGGAVARPPCPVAPVPVATVPPPPREPPSVAQAFAEEGSPLAFHDPERRKKLATAFPRIDEIGRDALVKQGLPSIALGVIIDGDLAYAKGFGARGGDATVEPDADTVFRVGSMTKSFTAAVILSLRDEGALSLDDPLAKWVPEAAGLVYPTHDTPPITLRQLLTHTSGLPVNGAAPDRAPTEEELVKSLAGLRLENPPGTRHVYSNLGFALLGLVASHVAHAPYREVVNKRVLGPLGMTSTVWNDASVPAGRLATAFRKGQLGVPTPVPQNWLLGAYEGAGGLYSSVRDMAKYVAFQLDAYPPRSAPEGGPIRRSSVREGHFNALWDGLYVREARAPQKGDSLVDAIATRYGYGWVVEQNCDFDRVVWHNGRVDGYSSDIAFLPDEGVGVVVLTNLHEGAPEPIAWRMLAELRRSGGLVRRSLAVSPALMSAMSTFLDVYNAWDETRYKAMLTAGRPNVASAEKAELAGYKELHGACKGYAPVEVEGPTAATFLLKCERGTLEMDLGLGADGKVSFFAGHSHDLPLPPALRKTADGIVGLVKKWDDGVFKKHLAKTKQPRAEAVRYFDDLREAHGACEVKSLGGASGEKRVLVACERGGDLTLTLTVDANEPDAVTSYAFSPAVEGTCPMR